MQIKMLGLAPEVYAAGQLFEADLQLLADQGVRSIVNTQPGDGMEGQPLSANLAGAAAKLGITIVDCPVDPMSITEEAAEAFWKVCEGLERPLIVSSRSGALSTRIWESAEPA